VNPLLSEASNSIDGGWILGIMTLIFFATFLYWAWYAYAPAHRDQMEAAGRMPFEVEEGPGSENTGGAR